MMISSEFWPWRLSPFDFCTNYFRGPCPRCHGFETAMLREQYEIFGRRRFSVFYCNNCEWHVEAFYNPESVR